jgi:hypothetical protein
MLLLLALPLVSAEDSNVAIVDAQFLATPTAHSLAEVMVTVKNTGDVPVDVYMELKERIDGGDARKMHIALYETILLEDEECIEGGECFEPEPRPMESVEVISPDGSKRMEEVTVQSIEYYIRPLRGETRYESGKVIVHETPGRIANLKKATVSLNPEDSIELQYVTSTLKRADDGQHTVEFILKTNEIEDVNSQDNIFEIDVNVVEREPLVIAGPTPMKEKEYPALASGEYWVFDYWEHNNEEGNLCTEIENKEICFIREFDGVHFPFSVDGKLKRIGFFSRLFRLFSTESEAYLHGTFGGHATFTINGVKITYMDTGFKVRP